jgi:hypothetical protein
MLLQSKLECFVLSMFCQAILIFLYGQSLPKGAKTLNMITLSIMTVSIMPKLFYRVPHLFIIMLSVIMLNVVLLIVVAPTRVEHLYVTQFQRYASCFTLKY